MLRSRKYLNSYQLTHLKRRWMEPNSEPRSRSRDTTQQTESLNLITNLEYNIKMEFIEIYHKESDRTITIPELDLHPEEEMEDFLQRERPLVIRAMAVALTLMIEFGTDTMPCFIVKDSDSVFNVHREEAVYSVDRCIEYFEEIEDYEKCIKLTKLKEEL
jgi:hypothetical protein